MFFLYLYEINYLMNKSILQVVQIKSENSDLPPAVGKELSLPAKNIEKFIEENYTGTTIEDWNDWIWQIKNSITSTEKLIKLLGKKKNGTIINMPENHLPFRITPYFAHLLSILPTDHVLYKTIIPTVNELNSIEGEQDDPLDEQKSSPVPNIVHRYPDRALFLVTNFCSTFCRYCTRSHMVSKENHIIATQNEWEKGFQYIENNKNIRDVIVSGGDPLTLKDDQIEYILQRLRNIKHVEIIRIGTKVPVVLPMRITPELVNILKKYHPLYINIHFTHPDEITEEVKLACNMLVNSGIPLGSQTVLLKDINDNTDIIKKLVHELLMIRVKPYYIFSCDKIPGSKHFQSTIDKGLEIIDSLRGHTSGFACPQFVVDSSKGKISLLPNFVKSVVESEDKKTYVFRNYNNEEIIYEEIKK